MNLQQDTERFDQYQLIFITDVVSRIRVKLIEAGLEGEQLQEATAAIAYSVSNAIDGMANIEADGVHVRPYLTFRAEGSDEDLIHCGENSYTFEFMYDALKKVFD